MMPTIGRELVGLQDARESGALSDEEYIKLKKEIMKGGPAVQTGCFINP